MPDRFRIGQRKMINLPLFVERLNEYIDANELFSKSDF